MERARRLSRALTRPPALMGLVVLVVGTLLICFGEQMRVGGGFGYDGATYGRWAQSFYDEVFGRGVSEYRIQRTLASAVVHYALRAVGAPLTNDVVVRAFQIYDLVLLVGAAVLWGAIARSLRLSSAGGWLGFVALFANFANLKQSFYDPVLLDTTAFALGMLMLWAYLADRPVVGWLTAVVGSFAWPSLGPVGLALVTLPRHDTDPEPIAGWRAWLPGAAAAAIVAIGVHHHYLLRRGPDAAHPAGIDPSFFWLSFAVVIVYVTFGVARLLEGRGLWRPLQYARAVGWRRLAVGAGVAAATLVALRLAIRALSNGKSGLGIVDYGANVVLQAVNRPFVHIVAHVVYFGPIVVLAMLRWREVARGMRALGPGLALVATTMLLQSIASESRLVINALPFLVAFTMPALRAESWSRGEQWLFVALCLVCSKIWFPIELVPLTGDALAFPMQRYFMNFGPWMSDLTLIVQGAMVAAMFLYYGLSTPWASGRCPPYPERNG